MASLKGKSGESLRQMLGDKGLMQTLMRTKGLLDEIVQAEDGYRDERAKLRVSQRRDLCISMCICYPLEPNHLVLLVLVARGGGGHQSPLAVDMRRST